MVIPITIVISEFTCGIIGILTIAYMLYKHMIPYDLKVEGVLFLMWAILNLTNGIFNIIDNTITNQTYVSIGIGFTTLVIASYKYYPGGRVRFTTLKKRIKNKDLRNKHILQ